MKFTCPKPEFLSAIGAVSKAIASKPQTPILSGIYLRAEGNQLELQATDYEIGIIYQLEADIEEPGQLVLSGRYLQEVIRRLPGDVVSISHKDREYTAKVEEVWFWNYLGTAERAIDKAFAGTTAGLWFHQDVPFIYPGDILVVKES